MIYVRENISVCNINLDFSAHLCVCGTHRERECDEVQACLRSVKLCWAWPLPSRPPVEGPGGRAALRDRVHGHFLCRVDVAEKKWKHQALSPEACRCCQRAEPEVLITKPNIDTIILWQYHPAAAWAADFVDASLKLFILVPTGLVTPHLDWLNSLFGSPSASINGHYMQVLEVRSHLQSSPACFNYWIPYKKGRSE